MVGTGRANNVIRIPTSVQGKFFRIWIEFLTPLHNLTNREKDVVAAFIKARFELSKSIPDPVWLDKAVMSDEIKTKIKKECKVSDAFFQVILGKLRKTGVIEDGKISPKFIPKKLDAGDKTFQLLLYFDLDGTNNQ
jgi:hypothetical protein